jgi:hypothetical protein
MKPTVKTKRYYESDFAFLIKAALYLMLGLTWLSVNGSRMIPVGVILGFVFSKVDVLRIDRKIEYALLVVGALLGLVFTGIGLTISITL